MHSSRNLRYLIEYGLLRAGLVVLRLLPLDMAIALSGRLCAIVAPWTSLNQRALVNLQHAFPEQNLEEHRRILKRMWENAGRVMAETLMLDRIIADPKRIEIAERQAFERILQAKGSNIGLTLHLGNWELVARACELCGGRSAAIYRPLRNPYLDRFVWAKRERLYPGGLLIKGTMGSTQPMGQATRFAIDYLRRDGHLGFVVDQVEELAPFTVPFFGWEATFSPAPAMLARRLGARVVIGRCVRVGTGSRFRFDFEELAIPRTEHLDADIKHVTAAIAARFEAWIREAPEQWMWWQRRSIGVRRMDIDDAVGVKSAAAVTMQD